MQFFSSERKYLWCGAEISAIMEAEISPIIGAKISALLEIFQKTVFFRLLFCGLWVHILWSRNGAHIDQYLISNIYSSSGITLKRTKVIDC